MEAPLPSRLRDLASNGRSSSASSRSHDLDSPSSSAGSSAVSHSLASILNNPHAGRSDASWSLWWSSSSAAYPDLTAPFAPSVSFPEVARADFLPYISSVADAYSRFEDILSHRSKESAAAADDASGGDGEVRGQGEALVACLREVPSLFFKEDFALEEGATFKAACSFSPSGEENMALQERLTQYLDVVEMHLVREISLRSDSFYEAQGQLQGLNGQIVEACVRIRELKETIRILTGDLVGSARKVQELNATRGNLLALHQKLTVILYVSQALGAMKLLVAAADCAGALDVIDDLQQLLDTDELVGLHCFRHLRDQLSSALDSINSILSAEFMRASIPDGKVFDSMILSRLVSKASDLMKGVEDQVKLEDEESSNLQDCLLPLIIGLLRTAKLPSVLRLYRDTLITEMKASIKATVAASLPVLLARPMDSDLVTSDRVGDSDGGSLSLASKLRSLSPESFVLLLKAIYNVVQAHLTRAAEVKRIVELIMGNVDGCYAVEPSVAAVAHGTAEGSQENNGHLVPYVSHSLPRNPPKISLVQGKANDSSPSTSKNFRADVLRENTEAVFAACDAAHGRWAKLLGVRALLHPKLRLQEFLRIYDITQNFIAATEKLGGRLGYSIRGTLQSQSKAFVDYQHDCRMTKIKAVLDQETWVAVDVPDEFQAIVILLSSADVSINNSELLSNNPNSSTIETTVVSNQDHTIQKEFDQAADHDKQTSSPLSAMVNQNTIVESTPKQNSNASSNEPGRSASQMLVYQGVGYHMVNCGLILLKMLSEYVDISKFLPSLSSEVVHRVVEILKLFNMRTCQLVLGAGAMQVSGLKSITSKHLALASQIVSFVHAIIPEIQRVLFEKVPEARKALLAVEIERVAQDFKVHRDEIHMKLIQIMRERLLANLRKLPQIIESWNAPEDNDLQPSQIARSITKEVTYLHRILSQILLEADVHAIFRQVVHIFHSHISEAFSKLELSTPQAKNRLCRDIQHILGCIRKLPSDSLEKASAPNFGLLDELLEEKYGTKVG
ncbi:vacuolar protein sorting-associated protein 54, chloroplastic-like [Zingiber officinale]|uniref:vacuolar protein sorting-associated protein 54, chloroplastic-like n=1 Tax=Zingiber officinale TaxID=94328 RepID=UPI001C4D9200|nr:vacuolar protein sorting-associated protein 54, chloroplastic-like [Zingiber officinale]